MNIWDILILLAVAGTAALGLLWKRKRKRAGKSCCSGCSGNCSLCPGCAEKKP